MPFFWVLTDEWERVGRYGFISIGNEHRVLKAPLIKQSKFQANILNLIKQKINKLFVSIFEVECLHRRMMLKAQKQISLLAVIWTIFLQCIITLCCSILSKHPFKGIISQFSTPRVYNYFFYFAKMTYRRVFIFLFMLSQFLFIFETSAKIGQRIDTYAGF